MQDFSGTLKTGKIMGFPQYFRKHHTWKIFLDFAEFVDTCAFRPPVKMLKIGVKVDLHCAFQK